MVKARSLSQKISSNHSHSIASSSASSSRSESHESPSDSSNDESSPSNAHSSDCSDSDLDCSLCLRLFYEPLSFGCGHSFCRPCIKRALKFKQSCPICRAPIHCNASEVSVNLTMLHFIQKHYPERFKSRLEEARIDARTDRADENKIMTLGSDANYLPDGSVEMPLFIDRIALIFPNQPSNIFIYEARYVIMVTRCLSSNRRFVIAKSTNIGAMCTVVQVEDARMLSGGQYLLQVRGVGRCKIVGPTITEIESGNLISARVTSVDDADDVPDVSNDQTTLNDELVALVDRAVDILEMYFESVDENTMRVIKRRYGELPRRGNLSHGRDRSQTFYRKLSFWLPSALSLRRHGGVQKRLELFNCTSMVNRLTETCKIVVESEANPSNASNGRRLMRGRKSLLELGFTRQVESMYRVASSCFLLLAIFAGLLSCTFFKSK